MKVDRIGLACKLGFGGRHAVGDARSSGPRLQQLALPTQSSALAAVRSSGPRSQQLFVSLFEVDRRLQNPGDRFFLASCRQTLRRAAGSRAFKVHETLISKETGDGCITFLQCFAAFCSSCPSACASCGLQCKLQALAERQQGKLELECFLAGCFKQLMGKGSGRIGRLSCECVHMHAGKGLLKTLWQKMGGVKGDGRQNVPMVRCMNSLRWSL